MIAWSCLCRPAPTEAFPACPACQHGIVQSVGSLARSGVRSVAARRSLALTTVLPSSFSHGIYSTVILFLPLCHVGARLGVVPPAALPITKGHSIGVRCVEVTEVPRLPQLGRCVCLVWLRARRNRRPLKGLAIAQGPRGYRTSSLPQLGGVVGVYRRLEFCELTPGMGQPGLAIGKELYRSSLFASGWPDPVRLAVAPEHVLAASDEHYHADHVSRYRRGTHAALQSRLKLISGTEA